MKKVLVFSHAGVLDVNRAIFQELARVARIELVFIVPERWRGDLISDLRFAATPNDSGIRVIALPVARSGNGSLFFYWARIGAALGEWVPDLVFTDEEPWSLAAFQSTALFRNARHYFFTKQNLRKWVPPPFQWIQRTVFARSTAAFSVASEVTETLRWKGYEKKIIDLPHSFDPEYFRPLSRTERVSRRNALAFPSDAIVVSYFGRLTAEKGIDEFLGAAREILGGAKVTDELLSRVHFLVVGNGTDNDRVRAELSAGPRASRTKVLPALPHDQVGELLGISDILVLPSRTRRNWKEQFGRILVEAMATGSAVIGSDSGEIPHLIRRTGGGLVFHEGEVSELIDRIRDLAENPAKLSEFRDAGFAYVHENFTHRKVAERLAQDLGLERVESRRTPVKSLHDVDPR